MRFNSHSRDGNHLDSVGERCAQPDTLHYFLRHFDQHIVLLHVQIQRAWEADNNQLLSLAVRNSDNDDDDDHEKVYWCIYVIPQFPSQSFSHPQPFTEVALMSLIPCVSRTTIFQVMLLRI